MVSMSDVTELAAKAKILSEASGREEADVLTDLLDDGILNESNLDKRDLIDKAQDKVNRFRDLLASLVGIMVVVASGGLLDATGVVDIHDIGEEPWEDMGRGGCTYDWADNYDRKAEWDDGSCTSDFLMNPAWQEGCFFLIYESDSEEFDHSNPHIHQDENRSGWLQIMIDPDEVLNCGQRGLELRVMIHEQGHDSEHEGGLGKMWGSFSKDILVNHDATEIVSMEIDGISRGIWDIIVCIEYAGYLQDEYVFTGIQVE